MNVCRIRYYYSLCIAVLGKIRFKKKKMMMNGISRERKGKTPCRKHNTDRKVFDVASRQCEQQVENNYVNTLLNAIGTPSSQIRFMAHCHLVYRLNCRKNVRSWAAQYFCSCLCSSGYVVFLGLVSCKEYFWIASVFLCECSTTC